MEVKAKLHYLSVLQRDSINQSVLLYLLTIVLILIVRRFVLVFPSGCVDQAMLIVAAAEFTSFLWLCCYSHVKCQH